jgi:hypothetical protein
MKALAFAWRSLPAAAAERARHLGTGGRPVMFDMLLLRGGLPVRDAGCLPCRVLASEGLPQRACSPAVRRRAVAAPEVAALCLHR